MRTLHNATRGHGRWASSRQQLPAHFAADKAAGKNPNYCMQAENQFNTLDVFSFLLVMKTSDGTPVCLSSRMFASTRGSPVWPSFHLWKASGSSFHLSFLPVIPYSANSLLPCFWVKNLSKQRSLSDMRVITAAATDVAVIAVSQSHSAVTGHV